MVPFWTFIALHALVVAVANGAMCPNNDNTDEMRNMYLNYHNKARLDLAKGNLRDLSRRLGPAKNIYKLNWNCELEKIAKELAQGCGYDFTKHRSYGQNRETFYGQYGQKEFDVKKHIKDTLDKWWGKVRNSYVNQDNKYDPSLFEFSNMAHYKNTEIGCAHVICPDPSFSKLQILCVYKRIGYMSDSIMWRNGRYCRTGNDCTVFMNSTCEDGLCVRPKEKPDSGASQMCAAQGGMTDAVRKTFLDMHNFYRSLVATGQAVDKIDKQAPKAAAMPRLKYDCELEQSAIRQAGYCQPAHSQDNSYGENFYVIFTSGMDKRVMAEMSSESWFEELEDVGVGRTNILTQEMFNRPGQIGHYTQMVWQETKYVGCGIWDCSQSTLAFCQYKKPGNRFGNKIYEIGKPCSKCLEGETCNPTEGLCVGQA